MLLPADKKVLIVDDDVQLCEVIRSILIKLGLSKIIAAQSAVDAKNLMANAYEDSEPFDLILCDHHMKENSGLDLIGYIRMSLRFKSIAFITITSDSHRSIVLPYISAGADSFILKPVDEEDLYNKIKQVWSKRGLMPE